MNAFEEKYRRKTPSAEPAAATPKGDASADIAPAREPYKAFCPSTSPKFNLWIRTSDASKHANTSLPYSRMNHMITDGNGFAISLHFDTPVISVTMHGRNLVELHDKLLEHEVHWVMEFDARKWAALPDDAPCITGIEITRKPMPEQKDDDTLQDEKNPSGTTARH